MSNAIETLNIVEVLKQRVAPRTLNRIARQHKTKRGRPSRASVWEVVCGLIVHTLGGPGSLGMHFREATGKRMAESSLSERRQALPWGVFSRLMELVLAPCADPKRHSEAFYKGFRLIGIDGSQVSLRNTPAILQLCTKTVSRRLEAAFAKLGVCVLIELGTHNPVGAQIARNGESEWKLATSVLAALPPGSLLLGDKLFGVQAFVREFMEQQPKEMFLFRTRKNTTARHIKKLSDGSRLVEIHVRRSQRHASQWSAIIREIRASVGRRGHRHQEVRLWTNLLDEQLYPAEELVTLYTQRWHHELSYREIKHELRQGELLDSQTFETACQEVAALLIAASVVAQKRIELATNSKPVTAVGFERALFYTQQLWYLVLSSDGILSSEQLLKVVKRFRSMLAPEKVPRKRSRSCPRVVRQPVKGWPRKISQKESNGPINVRIVS